MTKRIIDSMSAEQIQGGWNDVTQDLLEYLESLCKPEPSWEDDVRKGNPVLCWVSDNPIPEAACASRSEYVDLVTAINEKGYMATTMLGYKYARPVSPNECWKPTKQGEHDA